MKILPDLSLDECSIESGAALILPGGNTWMEAVHEPVLEFAQKYIEGGKLVAAICGATLGLARKGVLNLRQHTSNDLGYLKMMCPNYKGEMYYKNEPAVTDGKLITASGVAPLEFAVRVLKALDVFSPETLDAWQKLYETHRSDYFYALMDSIQ